MKAILRIEQALLDSIHADLNRQHRFANERVGFVACDIGMLEDGYLLLASSYLTVEDGDYENDPRVGAMMGPGAIRKALQFAYNHTVAMFHVHRHEHWGLPQFSPVDVRENAKFVPDFWKVRPKFPHGALVLSLDAITGSWWNPGSRQTLSIDEIAVLGRPVITYRSKR